MRKKIFMGGMGGSGSRVVQRILRDGGGYYLGEYLNGFEDFMGYDQSFVGRFNEGFFNNNWDRLHELIDVCVKGKDFWSLKHGHLMFIVPMLKEWYPDAHYLHTVRHPIDNQLNEYDTHISYGYRDRGREYSLQDKMDFYDKHNNIALDHADYYVRLEDVCFKKEETINNLLTWAGVPLEEQNMPKARCNINVPNTIGRGKQYYTQFNHSIIKRLGY